MGKLIWPHKKVKGCLKQMGQPFKSLFTYALIMASWQCDGLQ
jgi:hypothetical protein